MGGDSGSSVLIAAGGTGGHIFPALAFGNWLREHGKAGRIRYLSGSRPLEAEIYRSQGVDPIRLPLPGSPLGGASAAQNFQRWTALLRSFFRTGVLLTRDRPDVCFLFGGYVSAAPLLWCRLLRIPAVMHEQNACAGKVTRLAARLGVPVASGWDECRGLGGRRFVPVGIPVRALKRLPRRDAAAALGLDAREEDLIAGVIGGSLGSASMNALVDRLSAKPPESVLNAQKARGGRFILVVLGDAPSSAVPRPNVRFVGRQWDMTAFYSLCDFVLCRAGASTLAELAAYGVPALAVPWMQAADGHQEANALNFVRRTGNPLWLESAPEEDLNKALLNITRAVGPGPVMGLGAAGEGALPSVGELLFAQKDG
ncbi:MAG: UDP-N-acetylglucosamine--N-acetylmuramyl-(pentapeptide) pyrophosphoryl-undecaprenol N-acetylglucosamine transferase [Synergistaceae bacterium]|jgi:UDP-N-acetylglucosamine--N-acetylmuramyl-(pentapeptide) pyrophosphoryl-undecaprenol N-acetylglucosamine transferase|nr:UDP-N-acetylglucosamine--N-acetylmuramyl-(pentapeptide) pyrophosphoryl-undecaprenol N-acetylglucosamine transferase [Synergistaceae bacterium]